jgi:hypothetical protein
MSSRETEQSPQLPVRTNVPEPQGGVLQRKCGCGGGGAASALTGECDDCQKKQLQRRASGRGPADAPPIVDEVLASAGQPLDPASRADMEARFGSDFSSVRIHTDARAAESAEAVSAHAYTVGSHVAFGAGRFTPGTREGRHLLAHELTHTIQQSSSRLSLQRQALVGAAETPAEAEAEQTADRVTAGPGFIVDDDAPTVAPGQMRRSAFLDEVTRAS